MMPHVHINSCSIIIACNVRHHAIAVGIVSAVGGEGKRELRGFGARVLLRHKDTPFVGTVISSERDRASPCDACVVLDPCFDSDVSHRQLPNGDRDRYVPVGGAVV